MDLRLSDEDEFFRKEVQAWLNEHLTGEFAALGGSGTPGQEEGFAVRRTWERELGRGGWIGLGWPREAGGRGASVTQQFVFNEEHAKAGAPGRVGFFGEGMLGPAVIAFGSDAQKARFLPPILSATELWCQGFSEPDAGSDLANIKTTATLDDDGTHWVICGQKVWTSLVHHADWCFLLCRTDLESSRREGLSFLLCPIDQPGVEVRPLRQMTGSSEFSEVFFNQARTPVDMVVGGVGNGWQVAMATLSFERGTAFLAHQLRFEQECVDLINHVRRLGTSTEPLVRQKLAQVWIGAQILKYNGLRTLARLSGNGDGGKPQAPGPESSIAKLSWSSWHRSMGELEMELRGPQSQIRRDGPGYRLEGFQQTFLFSRADTIYAGSSEIQRTVIAEHVLGLPREPKPPAPRRGVPDEG